MVLIANTECPSCGAVFEGEWRDDSIADLEDMAEAPETWLTCPGCGETYNETWPGWANWTEAG